MIHEGSWNFVDVSPGVVIAVYPFETNGNKRVTLVFRSEKHGQYSITDPEFITEDEELTVGNYIEVYTLDSKRYPGRLTIAIDTLKLEQLSPVEIAQIMKGFQ